MKAYDELIDFLAAGHSSEELAHFEPSESVRARAWYLVQKEKEQVLTDDEQHELAVFAQLEQVMRLVKARARRYAQAA